MSFFDKREPVPLIYPEITEHHNFINVLLINNQVPDYQTFVDSVNSSTFPIVYSTSSSKTELLTMLQTHFKSISRIGLAFSSNVGNINMFLDNTPFFKEDEIEPYSENMQFLIVITKEFQIKNIDYLACNTLNFPAWVNYYQLLTLNTGVIVGASNDETGNIKYGGDWLMESTGQDIELIYFTKSIEYYTYLLDNLSWSTGYSFDMGGGVFYNNFLYVPNYFTNTITQTNLNGSVNNSTWATGLSRPEICVTYGTDLYVSNYFDNTISKISLLNPAIKTPAWATGLDLPYGLAVFNNDLYVSNFGNNTISKISLLDPAIKTLNWATGLDGPVGLLDGPVGLAVFNTDLYVSNVSNNTISKISLLDPADNTPAWATGLNGPAGLAVFNNDLYVSNLFNGQISKISLLNPATKTLNWATGLNFPFGLTVFENNLYVSNYDNQTISQISLPTHPCFKEDTKILTDKGYLPIQELRTGDLVKTLLHDYKPIVMIGKREIYHPAISERIKDQLYQCSHPEVFEPLVITGCHSILVENSTTVVNAEQIEKVKEVNGGIYLTDDKLRLPACVDDRTSVYEIPGTYTIYHLALEHDDYYMNYGIYANGLLVETCSQRYLTELSNMDLIE